MTRRRESIKKQKIFRSFLFIAILLGTISFVVGFQSDFPDFEGDGHSASCHGGTNPESATGYVEILSPEGLKFAPSEVFNVSVQVFGFSEAASQSILVGFPDGTSLRGDNNDFTYNISYYTGVTLDGSGNSATYFFEITAPSTEGNFTLFADAMYGTGGATIEWTHGELELEIAYPAVAGAPILENLTINSDPIEVGQLLNIQVDAYDVQTIIAQVLIKYNETNHSMLNSGGNRYEYSSWNPILEGEHNFWIYAVDTENNTSILSGSVTVQDTNNPQMSSIIQSSDIIELGSEITISINITDASGIESVEIELEGTNHSMENVVGNSYRLRNWLPGILQIYNYTIYAIDINGNINLTNGSFVVFMLGAPKFNNFFQIENPLELGDICTISVDVTDDIGIDNVWINITDGLFHMNNTNDDTWIFKFFPTKIGTYPFTIIANDTDSNIRTFLDSALVIDTTLPNIMNYSVIFENNHLNATISAVDFSGIRSVTFGLDEKLYNFTKIESELWQLYISENFTLESKHWTIIITDNNGIQNIISGNFNIQDPGNLSADIIKNIYSTIIYAGIGAFVVTIAVNMLKMRKKI